MTRGEIGLWVVVSRGMRGNGSRIHEIPRFSSSLTLRFLYCNHTASLIHPGNQEGADRGYCLAGLIHPYRRLLLLLLLLLALLLISSRIPNSNPNSTWVSHCNWHYQPEAAQYVTICSVIRCKCKIKCCLPRQFLGPKTKQRNTQNKVTDKIALR